MRSSATARGRVRTGRSGNASGMDDDGTLTNRLRRDGGGRRGAGQTHGADDPSGVDVEPDVPPLRFPGNDDQQDPDDAGVEDDAAPPSAARPS